jgi:hypothetical protein
MGMQLRIVYVIRVGAWVSSALREDCRAAAFGGLGTGQLDRNRIWGVLTVIPIARRLATVAGRLATVARRLATVARRLATVARRLATVARRLATIAREPATVARGLATIAGRLATIANNLATQTRDRERTVALRE